MPAALFGVLGEKNRNNISWKMGRTFAAFQSQQEEEDAIIMTGENSLTLM